MLCLKKGDHEKKYYITDGYSENDVSSLVNTNTIFNVDCSGLIVNGCYCLILSVIVSLQSEEMIWRRSPILTFHKLMAKQSRKYKSCI